MPLIEPSETTRRNAQPSSSTRSENDIKSSSDAVPRDRWHSTHSAVQGMLRLRTETGNVGLFSNGPSLVRRPGSKRIIHTAGSFESLPVLSSRKRHSRPTRHRSRRFYGYQLAPSFPRHDTTLSGSAIPGSDRAGHGRLGIPHPCPDRTRAFIRSPASFGFYSHRSCSSLRTQHERGTQRAESPYLYPARLRRSSQRPMSPTWSEAPSSIHGSRSAYPRSMARRVTSHSSMISRRAQLTGCHSDMHSSPSLIRSTSPSFVLGPVDMVRTPLPSRGPTPVALPISRSTNSNSPRPVVDIGKCIQVSRSCFDPPLYYDYTEPFADEKAVVHDQDIPTGLYHKTLGRTMLQGREVMVARSAQTPFGLTPGSTFRPSELPTRANRRNSDRTTDSSRSMLHRTRPSEASSMGSVRQEVSGIQVSSEASCFIHKHIYQ